MKRRILSMSRFTVFADEKIGECYYYTKHESGLDVFVFPKKMKLKTALLGVKLGSVYEEGASVDGEARSYPMGIAHFLEHKLFSSEDGVDAIASLAALGADANAYTSNNKTVYMFSCTENFDLSLKGLIDFVYAPYFTDENVESEKGIITQEIKMCLDSPYDAVSRNLLLALYGDCKLSSDVLGTEESIREVNKELLYDCYSSFYRYSNMALVVSGDVDENTVIDIVDKSLPKCKHGNSPILPSISYESAVATPVIEKSMNVSIPIFEIGIKDPVPSKSVMERLKRDVGMTILDEMLFSRASELYNDLFEGGYINESYTYGYSINRDVAFHSISAEGDNAHAVLEAVKAHVRSAKENGLSKRDFVRCKRVMIAEFIRDFDSVFDIANSLLNFTFEGSDIFEYRRIIEEITFEDVCSYLDESFADDRFAISIIINN